ncbi:hypothetical protein HMPREF0666_02896 [Prevotella sp. C561]|uniref:Uncharacterized protein n=2 Tax=Prevotella TaxID=838 RepID=A0AA94IU31_9BACT|nr:hypothetical protein HMPREF0666_02896 [Prevotella sp. C561]SHF89114.1 hypothetical protein SAMN05444364_11552 [Prevotella scopos JCM 17725]SNR74963.1 hypothetical protein SAMN06265364_10869 [Prevotella jejuni]
MQLKLLLQVVAVIAIHVAAAGHFSPPVHPWNRLL